MFELRVVGMKPTEQKQLAEKCVLTNGGTALVDESSYSFINRWSWQRHTKGYAYRSFTYGRKGERRCIQIYMHRLIARAKKGQQVDHINGDRLDNRKSNLRICSSSENAMNRKKQSGFSSRYKGVSWNSEISKWVAQIKIKGDQLSLGSFVNEISAAKAYNKAAKIHFGEFACINQL